MPLHIIREDITRMQVDAIVAAGSAKPGTPAPTGGVNGSIHIKAGARLLDALRRLGGIRTAGVTLTEAYDLPCKYVIHTAGPVWRGGSYGEETLLRACYREALLLAARQGFTSIAFPLISSGKYGYPKAEAMQTATSEIRAFLRSSDMDVYLVVYDREAFRVSSELFADVEAFIDQHYVDERYVPRNRREEDWAAYMTAPCEPMLMGDEYADAAPCPMEYWEPPVEEDELWDASPAPLARSEAPPIETKAASMGSLEERLRQLDEGFPDMLLRLIDERGMKDSDCYRKANVDRKLFNKIKNNPGYSPKKSTVAAFCIALELDMAMSRELLARAGYALSRSNIFDVIVEYFILKGDYDVDKINQVLFSYDQPLLGSNGVKAESVACEATFW